MDGGGGSIKSTSAYCDCDNPAEARARRQAAGRLCRAFDLLRKYGNLLANLEGFGRLKFTPH